MADEFRLRPDVLDIKMPVITFFHFLTHSLFRGIAVWQGEKYDDGLHAFPQFFRPVNGHAHTIPESNGKDPVIILRMALRQFRELEEHK
jgi:hypothetical protein